MVCIGVPFPTRIPLRPLCNLSTAYGYYVFLLITDSDHRSKVSQLANSIRLFCLLIAWLCNNLAY